MERSRCKGDDDYFISMFGNALVCVFLLFLGEFLNHVSSFYVIDHADLTFFFLFLEYRI